MLSGADLRQVLQAGLWIALADGSDRAAMRATCRDARDMADELHDTAVLPVGPETWDSAATIAACHHRLGAVRSVHVRYSGDEEGEARAAHFMEAYSAALGAALPAAACSIAVAHEQQQLPPALVAVLLRRVVPRVERLDMALGSYDNVAQLLQALEPCARLCSLRLLPTVHDIEMRMNAMVAFRRCPGALEALCRLPRLHTLSGPWCFDAPDLQRLCDALPSLTTLGFTELDLHANTGACISRRLHLLTSWRYSESLRLPTADWPDTEPWHLEDSTSTCSVYSVPCNLQAALPAVRRLDALQLTWSGDADDLPAIQAETQRFAACAERWSWKVVVMTSGDLQALRGIPQGSLSGLKHLRVYSELAAVDEASALAILVAAAPNMTMLSLSLHTCSTEALMALMQPLQQAAHLRTLWLSDLCPPQASAAQEAALLEGVVRCLAQPGAGGGDAYCRALQHVLLGGAQPDALAACRAALARDGIRVFVDTCGYEW